MKRARQRSQQRSSQQQQQPVGASEFCACMNSSGSSSSAQQLSALQRFCWTVRRDRKVALAISPDSGDNDDSSVCSSSSSSSSNSENSSRSQEENKEEQQAPAPKRFKETWKEDSAAYNVPFVGTAIATQQAPVTKGEWPTGLLQQYLKVSPLAIELTEFDQKDSKDNNSKDSKQAVALTKAYLKAVAELITAAHVVVGQPRQNNNEKKVEKHDQRFLSDIVTKRLPGFLTLLAKDTSNGKGVKSNSMGGGGASSLSCGPLSVPLLQILSNLVVTSTQTARHVARLLEQQSSLLPAQVLPFLLRRPPPPQVAQQGTNNRYKAHAAALQLTTKLTETKDPVVISVIGAAGIKDRKMKPGMLYLALQRGMPEVPTPATEQLFRAVRCLPKRRYEIFSKECVQNLSSLTAWAPKLVDFQQVLKATDVYNNNSKDGGEAATNGVEARRLLFLLLSDARFAKNRSSEPFVVKAMGQLLDSNLETRRFLLHVLTPQLMPAFFRFVSFPDIAKHSFAYAARLSCVGAFLRQGPRAVDCIAALDDSMKDETVMLAVLPQGLKKQTFTRALQNTNRMVALEALKLYSTLMERCRGLLTDLQGTKYVERVSSVFIKMLPDLQVLLAALSKLDVVEKSQAILFGYACGAVREYFSVFPDQMKQLNFDWTKLLPKEANLLCKAPAFVQRMVMLSMKEAIKIQTSLPFQPGSFKMIQQIALATRSQAMHQESRTIAMDLLCRLDPIGDGEAERRLSQEYEASCWVDGLTESTLEDFCSLLHDCSEVSYPTVVFLVRAWRKAGLPYSPPPLHHLSKLLVCALQRLPQASGSFSLLIAQVAMRCLLRETNPLPLAALIVDVANGTGEDEAMESSIGKHLVEYSRALVSFDEYSDKTKSSVARTALQSYFSADSYLLAWFVPSASWDNLNDGNIGYDFVALARQMTQLAAVVRDKNGDKCRKMLRWLLPLTILTADTDSPAQSGLPRDLLARHLSHDGSHVFDCLQLVSGRPIPLETHTKIQEMCALVASSSKVTFPDVSCRFAVLYLHTVGDFLPQTTLFSSLEQMLGQFDTARVQVGDKPFCRLTLQYLHLAINGLKDQDLGSLSAAKFAATALKAWVSLTAEATWDADRLNLVLHIEDAIFLTFRNGFSSLALFKHSSDMLLERMMETKVEATASANHIPQGCLLASAIASDPHRFASSFLNSVVNESSNDSYMQLFRQGLLDQALCAALNCCDLDDTTSNVAASLGGILNDRATMILSLPARDSHSFLSVVLAFTTFVDLQECDSLMNVANLLAGLIDQRQRVADRLVECDAVTMQENMIEAGLRLLHTKRHKGLDILSSTLLIYLGDCLTVSLRAHRKRKDSPDAVSHITPLRLTCWLRALLSTEQDYDKSYFVGHKTTFALGLIRACLRCGIGMTQEVDEPLRNSCLDLLRSFVIALQADSGLRYLEDTPAAAQVFSMTTTHSKFQSLLESSGSVKLKALYLVLECTTTTAEIRFDDEVWNCFLVNFDAGMTETDFVLRRLLVAYGKKAPRGSKCNFLDQLRWGESGCQHSSSNKWDWLVEAFDLGRVYATIECYPTGDSIDCFSLEYENRTEDSEELIDDQCKVDRCYSPGFLLPMILAALQDESYSSSMSESQSSISVPKEKGVLLSQRICEKGGLALALVSLCSKCGFIRKLSIAILSLLIESVNSQDAHQTVSWRERPQLAMVLNAVQRALVLRYAEDTDKIRNSSSIDVPKLPGFSAVFLARASLGLARPSDPMFLALNRAFLRSEGGGGAFQDLTRLPAFMSLFCSSAEDSEQVVCERKFALDLVRDGFTCQDNYKLLIGCHCPELLLTSVESRGMNSLGGSCDETSMLLVTLLKLVDFGGDRSASHLIGRIGLLSWLRSFLLGNNTTDVLPTMTSRIAFLKLATSATRNAAKVLPCDEMTAGVAGVAQRAISLALDSMRDVLATGDKTVLNGLPLSLISSTCQLLTALALPISESLSISESSSLRTSHGIQLASAIQFISLLQSKELLRSTLLAVCLLPVRCLQHGSTVVGSFCVLVLDSAIGLKDCSPEFKTAVLERICLLSQFLDETMVVRRPILRKLFAWWRDCAREKGPREAWHSCVTVLVPSLNLEADSNSGITDAQFDESSVAHWILRSGARE